MSMNIVSDIQVELVNELLSTEEDIIKCSIGIMAYNEEANIAQTLEAVLKQTGPSISVK